MNSPGVSVYAGDVAGLPIGSWTCDAKTFALPDGEAVHAIVFGEHHATRVDDRAAAHGFLSNLRLGGVADREHRMTQLLGGQHAEHVRLVLVAVDGTAQPAVGQARVMAGG